MAFMISFMTIYSVYYYTQKKKLDSSFVALVKDLPHTIMTHDTVLVSTKNEIIFSSIFQALPDLGTSGTGKVPDDHFVFFNNTNSKENLEKFYENLVTKFQNHPPIDFENTKEGERILLAYFFYNMRLPNGVRVSAAPIDFYGTKVKCLQYHPLNSNPDSMILFYKNDTSHEMAFVIKLNGGKEELVIFSSADSILNHSIRQCNRLIARKELQYTPAKDESVLFPELDFNLINRYSLEERRPYAALHDYKIVEERVKIKMSAPATGGPMEADRKYNTLKNFILDKQLVFMIRERNKGPYCIIRLNNAEILKPGKAL